MTNTMTTDWTSAIDGWSNLLKAAGASPKTIKTRRGVAEMAARSLGAALSDVDEHALIALCGSRTWSKDYRNCVRTSLVQFFDWAIFHDRHAGPNPARGLPKVPQSTPKARPLPDDLWCDLIADAPPRERLMARLAGEAGLRRAEVAQVHRDDLLQEMDGWALIVHGKGDKQRTVPIKEGLAAAIRSYHAGWSPQGYLFPAPGGGHLTPEHVGVLISRLLPRGWSMHKLRHRYACKGFAGTHNLRAVQEALGHASVATTQRYTAASRRDVRAVSEAAS